MSWLPKRLRIISKCGWNRQKACLCWKRDRDKIKQVLLNLLSNALKYNRPNGTVMLRAEVTENEICIHVQDTGVGIPDEALPHLFQKFYRVREHESRASGTGLGLSICKQIVHGHGGRIEVKSKSALARSSWSIFRAPISLPSARKVLFSCLYRSPILPIPLELTF
jgi:signal transduction histidine kinase